MRQTDMRMYFVGSIVFVWIIVAVHGCEPGTVYNTEMTIASQGYPNPYTPGYTCTWSWRAETGEWGIKFLEVNLRSQNDHIRIDSDGNTHPMYIKDGRKSNFVTGTWMNLTFESSNTSNPGAKTNYSGFKLRVLHGKTPNDLQRKFLHVTQPTPKAAQPDSMMVIVTILVIASVILFIALLACVWFICHRRRRHHTRRSRPSQDVTVTVDVKAIRKDSGTRYVRKTSTQSASEAPRPAKPVVRSASSRSWVTRAEASLPSARVIHPPPRSPVVLNLYTPMDKASANKQSQEISDPEDGYILPAEFIPGEVTGHGTLTSRSRLPTLERVPENSLLTAVPVSQISVSSDDGYMGPTCMPHATTDTYLNCPVDLPATNIQAKVKTRSASDSEYQNIRVTGRVQIS